jgi:hypothetical protein
MTPALAATPERRAAPPAAPAPRRPAAGGGAGDALFAAALAAHVAVALSLRHFPYQDLPNHLARYALIARAWAGAAPAWVDVRLAPASYVALDLAGAALVGAAGAAAAAKALAVAGAAALPLGMRRLLGAVAPAERGWAVAGVLLAFSAFYLSSFLSYAVGTGAAFAWLAAWWPRRAGAGPAARAGLALGMAALFLVHPVAPPVALVVVGVEFLCAARAAFAGPPAARRAALLPRLAVLAACLAGFGLAWGAGALADPTRHAPAIADPVAPDPPIPALAFRSPARKALALAAPFYGLSLAQGALLAAAYAAALALWVRRQGRAALRHPLALAALALLALYLVWPVSTYEARGIDVRWLLPAYLLPFCAVGPRGAGARAPGTRALAAVAALAVLHAGVVFAAGRRVDRDLDAYDRALARLPAGARVLPLVTPTRRHGARVAPFRHHAMWHVVRGRGRVAGLFAADGLYDDGYAFSHMAYVRERSRVYYPDESWGAARVPPLPWARIRRDFDVVIHAGDPDPRVLAALRAHARELYREGDVTVYAVAPAPAGARP